jgi:hypothetical protein
MNGTTYISSAVRSELDDAQAELERHIVTEPSGRCSTCGNEEPCLVRIDATRRLLHYGRLPRRKPGMARARIPASAGSGRNSMSWFEPTEAVREAS